MKESHETRLMGQICVSGWNRIGPAQADDTIVDMVVDMIMYWLSSDEASDITEDANVTWSWCGTFFGLTRGTCRVVELLHSGACRVAQWQTKTIESLTVVTLWSVWIEGEGRGV